MQSVRDAIELGTLSDLLGKVRARTLDAAARNA